MVTARSEAQGWQQATPGSEDVLRNLKRFLLMSAALPALLSRPVWAANWDVAPTLPVVGTASDNGSLTPDATKGAPKWSINPTLSVEETYTDNVSLTPDSFKQSDWLTQVIPGISIAGTGARLKFVATYSPELIYSARGPNYNQVFQIGNAVGSAELAKSLLFVDAGANVNQYNVSLQGPLTTSNINTTGNRSTVRTFFESPYLKHEFGSDVQAEARFTNSVVNSDDPVNLPNSVADRIDLNLKSGPAYKLFVWKVDYVRETINYDTAQDEFTETIAASARRLITPTLGLLAKVGYDYYQSGAAPALEGRSWSAGFDWEPTPRTSLTATAGQQFYGDAYSFDFKHVSRLTTWSAGYTQTVTTTRSEFFVPATTSTAGFLNSLFASQFPDPVARQKAVDEFTARTGLPPSLSAPINFFSSQLFVQKTWQASAGILGVSNVLLANVFKRSSEVLAGNFALPNTGDFATSNTVTQTGMSLQWNLRLTAQNAWNLGGSYSRNEFPGISRVDNLTYVGMGLTRQFQPRLSGSLNYRRQHNDSNVSLGSYTENAVLATLQMKFGASGKPVGNAGVPGFINPATNPGVPGSISPSSVGKP
jgi:uncharacterized protein (PEP-CTERM system associated)